MVWSEKELGSITFPGIVRGLSASAYLCHPLTHKMAFE
jgi:hypothetical protein